MPPLLQEIRLAARSLARTPAFACVVVLTVALGIGANAAIFGVVQAVLLRALDYPDPDGLAVVWEGRLSDPDYVMFASPPNYADWRARQRSFDDLGAFAPRETFLVTTDEAVRLDGARVTASLFDVLRVTPLAGRGFTAEDDAPGAAPVALISHRLWRDRFGADRSVIGRKVSFDGGERTIVGVMPPGFDFPPPVDLEGPAAPRRTDVWFPFASDHAAGNRSAHFMTVIGRLNAGVTADAAAADMRSVAADLARVYPSTNADRTTRIEPFEEVVVGNVRLSLLVLLAAVGAVLLIACVNVANLMLARSSARQKEYSIRAALGAGRPQLLRQALVESQLLALAGGAAGLVVAYGAIAALTRIAPVNVPRLDRATVDGGVLAFTLGLSVLTGLIFGLAPAARALRPDLMEWIRQGGRAGEGAGTGRARSALVVAEVALSLVLLVGGGLLFNSFLTLRGVDAGFERDNVVTMQLHLPPQGYPEQAGVGQAYDALRRRIDALPGIDAAGFSLNLPLTGDYQGTALVLEGDPPPDPERMRGTHFSVVTPGYFEAMGIPVLSGRGFSETDARAGPGPVLINARSAELYFEGRDPVGRRVVSFGEPRTIVGVVGDVRLEDLGADPTPALYLLHSDQSAWRSLILVVRSALPPSSVIAAVTREIRAFDPRIPVYGARTMDQVLAQAVAQPRFSTLLLLVFSGLALLLAAIGIYGVISYAVGQRTRELGIRMALGARPADALALVLRHGLGLVLAGVTIGLVASIALTRYLRSLLYEVSPTDPLTLAAVSAFLVAVALLACWIPAHRASRVDPVHALRAE